jgi:signal recognition particle receptor subunit beta
MEWSVVFMGPVGSGKTTAIRTISDIEVVNTDEVATDHVAQIKSHTTVSMDVGTMQLGEKDKLRLYGTPGQDRFDFMWDILLEQSKGVMLVINHGAADPLADLDHYVKALEGRSGARLPLVVCISHADEALERPKSIYPDYFRDRRGCAPEDVPPVVTMDARNKAQVRTALVAMTALLEMCERFPNVTRA